MTLETENPTEQARRGTATLLAGVVLEASDIGATQAFYNEIFRFAGGTWETTKTQITYRTETQSVGFVRKGRPRTYEDDAGYHQAYRVPRQELEAIVDRLVMLGSSPQRWREDAPDERDTTAYLLDPDGNRVQLVSSDGGNAPLLDHVAIEVFQFDYCQVLYKTALGGTVDSYHGWRWEEVLEARRWAEGDDPAAPWTKRMNPGYRDFLLLGANDARKGVPRPNTQLFLRYGLTRLGLISATKNRQEPRPEILRGTPRVIFGSDLPADRLAEELASRQPLPMERDGASVFLRDPDGNYAEVRGV